MGDAAESSVILESVHELGVPVAPGPRAQRARKAGVGDGLGIDPSAGDVIRMGREDLAVVDELPLEREATCVGAKRLRGELELPLREFGGAASIVGVQAISAIPPGAILLALEQKQLAVARLGGR